MKNNILTNGFTVVLGAVLCNVLWGSASPFVKIAYGLLNISTVPTVILFSGIQYAIAGIYLIVFETFFLKRKVFPKKHEFKPICLIALFQVVLQYVPKNIGLAYTTAVKETVITGSNALFCILASGLLFRQEKIALRKMLTCVLCFAAIAIVNMNGMQLSVNIGDVSVLLSIIFYGISVGFVKKYTQSTDSATLCTYEFIVGGIVMLIIGYLSGGRISVLSAKGAACLAYLAMTSAMAYGLSTALLKYNPVSAVSVYSFVTPVSGVLFSMLILREKINIPLPNIFAAILFITAAMVISGSDGRNTERRNADEIFKSEAVYGAFKRRCRNTVRKNKNT